MTKLLEHEFKKLLEICKINSGKNWHDDFENKAEDEFSEIVKILERLLNKQYTDMIELIDGCNWQDRIVVYLLVKHILSDGHSISIWNGDPEEPEIDKSTDMSEIFKATTLADEDVFAIHNTEGKKLGWFYLIYCNGSAHDPMVVITDHSNNDYCNKLYQKLEYGEGLGGH